MEHKITTIKELFNVVTAENVERLLLDLNNTVRHISEIKEHYPEFEVESFSWKDDNIVKSDINVEIHSVPNDINLICTCNIPQINPWAIVPNRCLNCNHYVVENYQKFY